MNSFIEELYYGNIDPQTRSSEHNKKVQHDMQTLNESEDFLTDKLSGEEKLPHWEWRFIRDFPNGFVKGVVDLEKWYGY